MVNLAVTSEPEETMYNIVVTSEKGGGESVLILRLHPSKWNENVCTLILHIQKRDRMLKHD